MPKVTLKETDLERLPSPPAAMSNIVKSAGDPSVPINKLVDLISVEPAFTIELLRAANSAATARRAVSTAKRAVMSLGGRAVRNMAVSHVVRVTANQFDTTGFDMDAFWEDSVRRATAARILAERCPGLDPDEAFTLGLVQDVGTLMLAALAPDQAALIQDFSRRPVSERLHIESDTFGITHDRLFAFVGTRWGLPADMLAVIGAHHTPGKASGKAQRYAQLMHAADLTADMFQARAMGNSVQEAWGALEAIGAEMSLDDVAEALGERMPSVGHEMGISIAKQPTMANLVVDVNGALLKMTDEYESLTTTLEATLAERGSLMEQLEIKNVELTRLATTDPLTGAYNRRHFVSFAEHAIATFSVVSVVMCDLDKFKLVNDNYGHGCGDDVLIETVKRFSAALAEGQMLGRIGGEEFALCLPGVDAAGAQVIADACRVSLESDEVRCTDGRALPVTGSFGGTTSRAKKTLDELLKQADEALYTAKETGRNRVVWAQDLAPA